VRVAHHKMFQLRHIPGYMFQLRHIPGYISPFTVFSLPSQASLQHLARLGLLARIISGSTGTKSSLPAMAEVSANIPAALIEAAMNDRIDDTKRLIKSGVDANATDKVFVCQCW